MTTFHGKPVTTWVDSIGTWHARVQFPDTGYGNTGELSLDRHWGSIRAAARRAIRAELEARTGLAAIAPVRLEVRNVCQAPSTMVHYWAEFAER